MLSYRHVKRAGVSGKLSIRAKKGLQEKFRTINSQNFATQKFVATADLYLQSLLQKHSLGGRGPLLDATMNLAPSTICSKAISPIRLCAVARCHYATSCHFNYAQHFQARTRSASSPNSCRPTFSPGLKKRVISAYGFEVPIA